ncbi:MAG: hypothetical protein ACRD1K_11535, partial [Acidimicrobiales bacterium]
MADASVASASVAEALATLRAHRLEPTDRPLPLTYAGWSAGGREHPAAGTGPLPAAVAVAAVA